MGRRGCERQTCGRGLRLRRFDRGEILEQRGGTLFERRGGTFFFLLARRRFECLARDLGGRRFGGGHFSGGGVGSGDFGGGAATALGAAVTSGDGLGHGFDDLGRGAAPFGWRSR